jgi:ABC-type Fe3+ transport system permease subunit
LSWPGPRNRHQHASAFALASAAGGASYAVPGTVLAIGLLTPALAFDAGLAQLFGMDGLPLMGQGIVLVAACVIRFLVMPVGGIEAGLARIPPTLEQASDCWAKAAWAPCAAYTCRCCGLPWPPVPCWYLSMP